MNRTHSRADTHIHTTFSDGMATPQQVVDYVVAKTDLRVIAITDHDSAEGALVAREYARSHALPIDVIVGQEVTTHEGDVVGLFIRETLPAFRTALEAVLAIHQQGGLAVAVHPFSAKWTFGLMQGVASRIGDLPLDGVEVRNGFPTNLVANPYAIWYNRRRGQALSELGGSDSHAVETIGQAHTLFPGHTALDLRMAMERGRTQAAGPLWTPGALVRVAGQLAKGGFHVRDQEPVYRRESVEYL